MLNTRLPSVKAPHLVMHAERWCSTMAFLQSTALHYQLGRPQRVHFRVSLERTKTSLHQYSPHKPRVDRNSCVKISHVSQVGEVYVENRGYCNWVNLSKSVRNKSRWHFIPNSKDRTKKCISLKDNKDFFRTIGIFITLFPPLHLHKKMCCG